MAPGVTIILVNWNGKEDTIECLESLRRIDYPNFKVLLVDNASSDGSVEELRQRYPDVELIVSDRNLGFAGGNNLGITRALESGADYLLLLNNDNHRGARLSRKNGRHGGRRRGHRHRGPEDMHVRRPRENMVRRRQDQHVHREDR